MSDEQVIVRNEWPEDGEYGDIIKLLHRIGDTIALAAEVTNEEAKKTLFTSATILIDDCKNAIQSRVQVEPVITEDDD